MLGGAEVVGLTRLPAPVVGPCCPAVEVLPHQRPAPAVDIVVQADPEGLGGVQEHFIDDADVLVAADGGQVARLCSAVALGLGPVEIHVRVKDVLVDVVRGGWTTKELYVTQPGLAKVKGGCVASEQ